MLPLPMTPETCLAEVIVPGLRYLPKHMDNPKARVMLLAIAQQESGLRHRWQVLSGGGKGPARGLWQFERGSKVSRGGCWGVFLHPASHEALRNLCRDLDVNFDPYPIWQRLEHDDLFACGVARLLLWTDKQPLPEVDDADGAWHLYAERTWRPGKPHAATWAGYHKTAREFVL